MKTGIIGCGNISAAYFDGAKTFDTLEIIACADINEEAAQVKARQHGVRPMTVDEIFKHPEIELIINLTIPKSHADVTLCALEAGKNVYSEKPLAVTRNQGRDIMRQASQKGLRVGSAPDTFLGGGLQTCRKLLDDGIIGKAVAGTAFMMGHGPEDWHPNPRFFYQKGAGPMFDMGPYYLTALIHLLGPIRAVAAMTKASFAERVAGCAELKGTKFPVEVPTHYSGTLEFHCGVIVTVVMSFDVWEHGHSPIEIYGTQGSLKVPDPNSFEGPVSLHQSGRRGWSDYPLTHGYADNMRSIGAADMIDAIQQGRPHRCSLEMAFHVLDVMHSFEESSSTGRTVEILSTCPQPSALPVGLCNGELSLPVI
ncbi:Gfo/Idh/MocA family oxidoreductase [Oscillatoria laete-virens NRMC-F 0139]|nr:Gfo/Idh/MocA family oxidoreductase [Oscillatoria laete-virens]MDL5055363.1 Gfo/Idh/MocA family oxidoreductase [Oscillatoria laete-virens NRMC-F 0139]